MSQFEVGDRVRYQYEHKIYHGVIDDWEDKLATDDVWHGIRLDEYGGQFFVLPASGMVLLEKAADRREETMDKDTERDLLCESDPIELADEILRLREKLSDTSYEYGMLQTVVETGEERTNRILWGTLKEAQEEVDLLSGGRMSGHFTYRVVKRRKAGPVEEI